MWWCRRSAGGAGVVGDISWGGVGRGGVGLGAGTVAGPVTDIEGADDVGDAERRGVEDANGAAGVDGFGRCK